MSQIPLGRLLALNHLPAAEVMGTVSSIEHGDRFGRIRDARDKELRDPDDVFIHAEERRKELAKQRKKR